MGCASSMAGHKIQHCLLLLPENVDFLHPAQPSNLAQYHVYLGLPVVVLPDAWQCSFYFVLCSSLWCLSFNFLFQCIKRVVLCLCWRILPTTATKLAQTGRSGHTYLADHSPEHTTITIHKPYSYIPYLPSPSTFIPLPVFSTSIRSLLCVIKMFFKCEGMKNGYLVFTDSLQAGWEKRVGLVLRDNTSKDGKRQGCEVP